MHIPTHALTGWILAQSIQQKRNDRLLVLMAAVIPDIDGLSLLWGIEAFSKWHHTFGHSLIGAVSIGAAGLLLSRNLKVGILCLISASIHIGCDWAGSAGPDQTPWAVYFFWPWDPTPYYASFQWELNSWKNVLFTTFCLYLVAQNIVQTASSPLDSMFPNFGRWLRVGLKRLMRRLPFQLFS